MRPRPDSTERVYLGHSIIQVRSAAPETDPAARSGIVGGGGDQHYRFTVLGDGLLRLEWAPDCVFEDRPSIFAAKRHEAPVPPYKVRESDSTLEIITSRFHLTYDKGEFAAYSLYALITDLPGIVWRYGEQDSANLRGTCRTLDGLDGPVDRRTGQKVELGLGVLSRNGYALLDDSDSFLLEPSGWVGARKPGAGRVDAYLFAYGHKYRDAIKALYCISGAPPVLPRWALGNWWCRYWEYTAESYLALMDRFRGAGIPLSVGILDMDWHLVDDPRVREAKQSGWTGYTWNRNDFPDPPAFIKQLHQRKLKTALNDHPADGIHSYEDMYCEVAKALNRDPCQKDPIPFDCVSPAYLHAYFNIVLRSIEDNGCDFWWIDWQQGRFSRMKGFDPLWMLNHFHFLHNARRPGVKHPMIFSRYAGPGSHRYPVGFSGDSYITWDTLDWQPEFTATASNIGFGWWSHDIGGFMRGIKEDELAVRWIQLGVLSPIMRLHATKSKWVRKEPWHLPPQPAAVVSDFLRLRHRLIPYLQTMNVRASVAGEPLVQPLYWEYPDRDEAYDAKNQYFFGSEMLIVPITQSGDAYLGLGKVKGWLPPGTYVDWFTGMVYEGDRQLWLSRTLDRYPVFLKRGSIVPLDEASEPENGGGNPSGFEVVVVVGADGNFDVLEDLDDGDDQQAASDSAAAWRCIPIRYCQATGRLEIGPKSPCDATSSIERKLRTWTVRFLGLREPKEINITHCDISVQADFSRESNGIVVNLGTVSSTKPLTITLGEDPQLRHNKPLEIIEPVLRHAQMPYDNKESLWDVLTDEKVSQAVKVSRLQTVDIKEDLYLFLTDCLLADPEG